MARYEVTDNLPTYFKEIKNNKPLPKEEERVLIKAIQEKDCQASMKKLIEANLKFVVRQANGFLGQGFSVDDLIQEGNIGLIEAARRFDLSKDVKFITFAAVWIRKQINVSLDKNGRTVRMPTNKIIEYHQAKKAGQDVVSMKTVELDSKIKDDTENTLGDLILKTDFEDPFDQDERKELVAKLLGLLTGTDLQIIDMFYGFTTGKMKTSDIAEELEIPVSEVSKSLNKSRKKMQKYLGV